VSRRTDVDFTIYAPTYQLLLRDRPRYSPHLPISALARAHTFSTVNPYSRNSTPVGAEAPKVSAPIMSPLAPT
jgi:hypothetical protein